MNIVLLSGGSGKRLWPLSNDTRSKQFFKVFKDKNGNFQSMIQRVYGQLVENNLVNSVVIATGLGQVESIYNQIGSSVEVVIEPERRDTFPAIALACAYLSYYKRCKLTDSVIVLPVDQYAEDKYYQLLQDIDNTIQIGQSNLTLMGIDPTYPSEKYGYIIPKEDGVSVSRFQEKPTREVARQLINSGALWNGGVFGFKLGFIINHLKRYIDTSSYDDVLKNFGLLPKNSFDYEIVEKEESITFKKYTGEWKDLGTWNTLTDVMNNNSVGRVLMSENCVNTHAINELEIPMIVLGVTDIVVASSPDGILVSNKEQSSYLKPLVDQVIQRPMYEEKSWGVIKVINYAKQNDNDYSLTRMISIIEGEIVDYDYHHFEQKILVIISGEGEVLIEGVSQKVSNGDVFKVGKDVKHSVTALTNLQILEVLFISSLD